MKIFCTKTYYLKNSTGSEKFKICNIKEINSKENKCHTFPRRFFLLKRTDLKLITTEKLHIYLRILTSSYEV